MLSPAFIGDVMFNIPKDLRKLVESLGIPRVRGSKVYLVDPVRGNDRNRGRSWRDPLQTLFEAEDRCVPGQNDCVLLSSADIPHTLKSPISWDKDQTHLVGVGLPCKVIAPFESNLPLAITFSGCDCIVRNVEFYNEKAPGSTAGVVMVIGNNNYFMDVRIATPAAHGPKSYSLKISGNENIFEDVMIGDTDHPRQFASYGIWLFGASSVSYNRFENNIIISSSFTPDHIPVFVDESCTATPWRTEFKGCNFINNHTVLGGPNLTQAVIDRREYLIDIANGNTFYGFDQIYHKDRHLLFEPVLSCRQMLK